MTEIEIGHAPAGAGDLAVAAQQDIALSIPVPDARHEVTWLTSCGTMHDFDLPTARLRVEPDDPATGQLALVVRDGGGGVAWRVWPIHAD
ncbi:MAG TPA: hypothetical protein VFT22_23550 [Kofleriaceae bacterium]|nr:hypothetical protein [Kofleriaceae bacterium]